MKRFVTVCFLAAVVFFGASSLRAADVDPMMEAVARELLRQATTNAQRASVLYEAACGAGKANKALRSYLDERALDYALKSIHVATSRQVALNAVARLRADLPDRRYHWYAMRIEIRRRTYHSPLAGDAKQRAGREFAGYLVAYAQRFAGERHWNLSAPLYKEALGVFEALGLPGKNELAALSARADRMARTQAKVTALEAQVKKTPQDGVLRRTLACLWIIDMNTASGATKYLSSRENKLWHDCAHRASYNPSGVTDPKQARQVGDWYYTHIVPLASPVTRRDMLVRAKVYYDRALALKLKDRDGRDDVQAVVEKIAAELKDDTKPGWTVIFRSDDPAVWNTDRPTGMLSYAVPLSKIGGPIRYLKLTRRNTGRFVIVPMRAMWLGATRGVTKVHGWQGAKSPISGGGYCLGIYSLAAPKTARRIDVTYSYGGWGFGCDRSTRKMACTWAGSAIAKTSFEIAVTNGDLTRDETKALLR